MIVGSPSDIQLGTDPSLGEIRIEVHQPAPTDLIALPRADLTIIFNMIHAIHYRVCTPWYRRLWNWVKRHVEKLR